MLSRFIGAFLLIFSTLLTASAAPMPTADDAGLQETATLLADKDYKGAAEKALLAGESPKRNFILGVSYHHLEKWSEAAEFLGKSPDGFTLLADYALYYRANALYRLGRYDEAIDVVLKLKKEYPESPFRKDAAFLNAEALFGEGDFPAALAAYRSFVEVYPTGSQSVKASFQAALCREAMGDREKAAVELRGIWLRYPASPVAAQAEKVLQKLAKESVPVAPYTTDELFGRGIIQFNLQKYGQALDTFTSLAAEPLAGKFKSRLTLKIGQTLFKLKRYKEAGHALAEPAVSEDEKIACEASFWQARTLGRSGDERGAFALYHKIASDHPHSELADDALFYAALISKYDGRYLEAAAIIDRLVAAYPSSPLVAKALWEASWSRYLAKDFQGAAVSLTTLLDHPAYREKALYWLGKSCAAAGDGERAGTVFATLASEYPYGFYCLIRQSRAEKTDDRAVLPDLRELSTLPVPAGYGRIKALVKLGLIEEAATELAAAKKKAAGRSAQLELARLYREIGDYRSAMGLFRKVDGGNAHVWSFVYPKAFSEHVSRFAGDYGVPESLAYSIIRAESNFHPTARSPVGAIGLMQLMPATAKSLYDAKSGKFDASLLKNPDTNISLGLKHMQGLLRNYDGNLVYAIAAYNSGGTPVNRWRRNYPDLQHDEFIENIPYPETREYVKKVMANMQIYQSLYGLDAAPATGATPTPAPSGVPAVTVSRTY